MRERYPGFLVGIFVLLFCYVVLNLFYMPFLAFCWLPIIILDTGAREEISFT